jgi:hypothetical protein
LKKTQEKEQKNEMIKQSKNYDTIINFDSEDDSSDDWMNI